MIDSSIIIRQSIFAANRCYLPFSVTRKEDQNKSSSKNVFITHEVALLSIAKGWAFSIAGASVFRPPGQMLIKN